MSVSQSLVRTEASLGIESWEREGEREREGGNKKVDPQMGVKKRPRSPVFQGKVVQLSSYVVQRYSIMLYMYIGTK